MGSPLGQRSDDPHIRLMRYQPVDIGFFHMIESQGFIHDTPQRVNRHFEDLVALHFHIGFTGLELFIVFGNPGRHGQQFLVLTIRMQMRRQNTGFITGG